MPLKQKFSPSTFRFRDFFFLVIWYFMYQDSQWQGPGLGHTMDQPDLVIDLELTYGIFYVLCTL